MLEMDFFSLIDFQNTKYFENDHSGQTGKKIVIRHIPVRENRHNGVQLRAPLKSSIR